MKRFELNNKKLKKESIERTTGYFSKLEGTIPHIKKKHYRIVSNTSVGGDAPKELLKLYQYESGVQKINNPQKWDLYIAKTGHKWYPYESITEYILNRIGQCLGLKMAQPKLFIINNQIRFLSKVFLDSQNKILEHGAELYHGYIGDKEFVEDIEKKQLARDFFTLSFTKETFDHIYPDQAEDLFLSFAEMLIFDAIIGNNDRHFYNRGILKHIHNKYQPTFSPIYDTARGLLWNRSEQFIDKLANNKNQCDTFLTKYIEHSKPKIGIEKHKVNNHFDLVTKLNDNSFRGTREIIHNLINEKNLTICNELIMDEMRSLLSSNRRVLINKCLTLRFRTLLNLLRND